MPYSSSGMQVAILSKRSSVRHIESYCKTLELEGGLVGTFLLSSLVSLPMLFG